MNAGATACRNGFFHVLDSTNGKFVSAMPFVQNITWAKGVDENGRPIYDERNRPGDPANLAPTRSLRGLYRARAFTVKRRDTKANATIDPSRRARCLAPEYAHGVARGLDDS